MPSAFPFIAKPRLTRSISASAAEEELSASEEVSGADEVGELPVFISSFPRDDDHFPQHFSSAAPHIQAAFPSPNAATQVQDADDDSTPLLVSSQPSSPAYTPSKTASLPRQQLPTASPPWPSSFSSASSSSLSSASSSAGLRPVPSPHSPASSYTALQPVHKPYRCSLATCLVTSIVCLVSLPLVFCYLIFPHIALYMTTGSPVIQPYEYYDSVNAARRLYPELYAPSGEYNEQARAALSEAVCPAPVNRTNAMPVVTAQPAADGITHLHIMVQPDESWTLFPWLWDSILVNHTWADPALEPTPTQCTPTNECHRCADNMSLSPQCHKWFPSERLAVHLVNYPIDRQLLPNISTLLIVGQWHRSIEMFDWLKSDRIAPLLPPSFRLLTLLLMGEECFNWRGDWQNFQVYIHPRLAAIFTTYGDCHLNPSYHQLGDTPLPNAQPIDMQQNVIYWPLGPSVEHGFPSRMVREEEDAGSAERARSLLLNLQVSINPEKSSRMQAWMETKRYCEAHSAVRCYNHNNDLVWKIVNGVDAFTGLSLHTALPIENPTDTQYLPLLANSTYTLCPAGKNPEQYRIWEALMVGSIPVIEDPSGGWGDEPFIHPAYGVQHRCTRYDVHRVLKKYRAPVVFVSDWRQLGGVLDGASEAQVVRRRGELKDWFRELKRELRREIFERVKYLDGRHEGD